MIGISNSLDMSDRLLPRLKEISGRPPHCLPFPSYTALQIEQILKNRLAGLAGPVFHDGALTFCSRKAGPLFLVRCDCCFEGLAGCAAVDEE